MRVSLEWLRDWVELDGDAEARGRGPHDVGSRGRGRRARCARRSTASSSAKCSSVARHPNADRLSVCVGRRRHRPAAGRLRRAERRAPASRRRSHASARTLPERQGHRRRRAARRRVERHAVLGEGARARRTTPTACCCSTPTRRSGATLARVPAARRRDPRDQRDAEPRRLLQRARASRASSRRGATSRCTTARRQPRAADDRATRFPVELGAQSRLPAVRGPRDARRPHAARKSPLVAARAAAARRASRRSARSSTSRTT